MLRHRKLFYGALLLLIILAAILGGILWVNFKNNSLSVVFLDVGQGDAILIEQGSRQILIDGGRDGKLLLEKLGKYIPFWDRKIEVIIATHPDQDHIGGLIDTLRTYSVGTVIRTKDIASSQTFEVFEEAAQKSEAVEAKAGTAVVFPNSARLEIIYPQETVTASSEDNSNEDSVVTKLIFGENTFLLTGDLPETQEGKILNSDIQSQVLKVSHHGSKYSTSEDFLKKVLPQRAIISVGKNNAYGHPNQETLDRLSKNKIEVLRTDEKGDIIFECQNLKSKCQIN